MVMLRQINVLQFICPAGFYGAERWILALAAHLDTQRVNCELAVTEESSSQNLEIINHYPPESGKVHKLRMRGAFDLSVIPRLCQLIRERDIDILHTHGYKSDIIGLIAARMTGIKCLSTPHGFGVPTSLKHKLYVKLGGYSLRFFDKVAPLSQQLLDQTVALGVKKERIHFIENAVDITEIKAFDRTGQSIPPHPVIGFIGQLIPRKKIDLLIQVFERVYQQRPECELWIFGEGEEGQALRDLAQTTPAAENIRFFGYRDDRFNWLSQFSIFAMTSSYEGIPRCLMEAMAMEIPVIAFDIPGVNQLVRHEETGLLSTFGDLDKMAQQALAILEQPQLAATLSGRGRHYVEERFSATRMASEYCELYSSLHPCERH